MRCVVRAAMAGLALLALCASSRAEEPDAFQTTDFYIRLPLRSTDRIYSPAKPKKNGQIFAPEGFLSWHYQDRHFEARADARLVRRRTNLSVTDRDYFLGEVSIGPRWGATSVLLDWQPSQFSNGYTHRKTMEWEEIGLKIKSAMAPAFLDHQVVTYFIEASRLSSHPADYGRDRLYGEASMVFPAGAHTNVSWTLEAGTANYYNLFYGKRRFDTIVGLRRMWRREFGSGLSFGFSLYGSETVSTHSQKSGFDFEVRPDFRFRWN